MEVMQKLILVLLMALLCIGAFAVYRVWPQVSVRSAKLYAQEPRLAQ
jgi:hypothetical protein